ncbi:MAG: DegV family protein, partial [Hydrogenoanaerobacterium sp.]
MNYKLIVDSCCDMLPALKEKISLSVVPLSMKLGDMVFVDDEKLNIPDFIAKMKSTKVTARSSCPSPGDYADACAGADTAFIVTLSSNLSGSYNSAVAGKQLLENKPCEVHVVDSKSASAGE